MLRAASDGLVAPPGLLDRPSDLSQYVSRGMGSRPLRLGERLEELLGKSSSRIREPKDST